MVGLFLGVAVVEAEGLRVLVAGLASMGATLRLPWAFSEGAFQYQTIWRARMALRAKPEMNPQRISWSSTSWRVVKIREREPAR